MPEKITGRVDVYEARRIGALIRFYFKVDPHRLTDDEFAEYWGDLKYALEFEAKRWSGE